MAARVTALIAAFIPGASPPEVRTPIVLIFAIFYSVLTLANLQKICYFCRLGFLDKLGMTENKLGMTENRLGAEENWHGTEENRLGMIEK